MNTTSSTFTVDKQTPPVYGGLMLLNMHHSHNFMILYLGFKKKARFYALNILEELDSKEEVWK